MTKEEARKLCLTDPFFLGDVLGYDFQKDVHAEMFEALDSDKLKAMILISRGHFKTSAACCYIVQRILRNSNIRVILMSATLKLTKNLLSEIRSHFDGRNNKSKLPDLFPEFCTKGKTGTELSWTCPARTRKHLKEPSCWVASQKSTQTGQHADLIFVDDAVHSTNWRSVELQDKLEQDFWHLAPLLDPHGQIRVTGTRYAYHDLYQRIITKDTGVNEWHFVIRGCYKPDGSLLFPERLAKDGRKIGFTTELLDSIKRDDYETFVSQYLNEIFAGGQQLFPPELIQRITKSKADPEYPAQAVCVFVVDLANTATKTADDTVIAVGKPDSRGRVWTDEVAGGQWSPFQIGMTLIAMYLKWRPSRIFIEKAAGAEFFAEFLRTLARDKGLTLPLDFIKVSRAKDAKYLRVASLESAFKTGRMFLLAGMTDYEKVTEECIQFPRGRHDDRPDAIALLYSALAANIAFVPMVKKLPYFFDVPFSTESKDASPCLLGDGFSC
jgi:predicted phage terminase large subunit-like protein